MIKVSSKKIVSSLIATVALTATLNAADFGSVNGKEITKQDVAAILRNPNINFNTLPKENQKQIIEKAIEKKLLTEAALKSDVQKGKTFKMAIEKLKEDLTLEVWMQDQFKNIKVSNADEKAFYEKNKAKFKVPSSFESRHILVKTEKEAKEIIAELNKAKDAKAKFVELAKAKSVGPTGPKGGYLGKTPADKMVPEFSKGALSLKKGTFSKSPVKTQFGYHVIYLEDKTDSNVLAFDKVKNQITQVLKQEKFAKAIQEKVKNLKSKAKIVIK